MLIVPVEVDSTSTGPDERAEDQIRTGWQGVVNSDVQAAAAVDQQT